MHLKRCIIALSSLLALLFVPVVAVQAVASGPATTFVVDLKEGVDPSAQAPAIADDYDGRAGEVFESVLGGFAFTGSDAEAARLARDPRVAAVERDAVYRIADNPPSNHRDLNRTDVPEAYVAGYTGRGVKIALLDTGVRRTHVVFRSHNNILSGKSCVGGSTRDPDGHGTASASNAAGKIGVAHEAKIVPVKVFPDGSLSTSLRRLICGLNWVKAYNDAHPTEVDDIDVVSMSVSGSGSSGLRRAVDRLIVDGVVITAAVGNHGGAPRYPAAYPGVIAVTALDRGTTMASFSAHGGDLTAPGVNIRSAENDSDRAFSRRTGTSRSTPKVAGAAAIILSENPAANVQGSLRTSGKCPNGEINGDTGFCPGRWRGDGDRRAEPLINAYCAGVLASPAVDLAKCGF